MALGENLAAARKAAGYSRAQMAEMIGISSTSYFRYENNLRNPKIEVIKEMANILNCSVEFLVSGIGEKMAAESRAAALAALIEEYETKLLDENDNINSLIYTKGFLNGIKKALEIVEE